MATRIGLRSGVGTLSMVFAVKDRPWRCRPQALAMAMAAAFAATGASTQTLPTGGVAVHGQAQIAQPAANQLVVTTQNGAGSGHSAINWQSFSISAGSSTRFVQPDAASLSINRVVTNTPSAIFGSLSSNGRLVLVNQSGIAVGAGAVVDTAGFTASALRMTDADALAGRLRFGTSGSPDAMGGAAGLTVDGRITARHGDVVLIAPQIGIGASALVQSPNGSTILAAGQQVEITGRGLEGISLLVQARDNEARNLGRLEGDAVAIFAGTLRHSGAVQATTATLEGGRVVLQAAGDTYVEGAGAVLATGSRGGRIDVLGERVALTDQALVDASGAGGGGSIRIGGDFQGRNAAVPNAQATYAGPETTVRADAGDTGDGGRIIVWADDLTKAHGHVSARGGARAGNGGFVEISGKQRLLFDGSVALQSPHGTPGTLLLDPDFIDVSVGGGATIGDVNPFGVNPGQSMTIAPATLNAVGGNVLLQAIEDITFNDPVTLTTPGAGLTAQAGGIITVASTSSITTNNGAIDLYANHPGAGGTGSNGSAVYVQGPLNSGGASISIRSDASDVGGNSIHLSSTITASGNTVTLNAPFDRIQQTAGAISAAILSANADYEIDLPSVSNLITSDVNLVTNTATGSSGILRFTNSATAYNLNGAVSKGNIQINSPGSMTTDGAIQSTTGNVSLTTIGAMSFGDDVSAAGTLSLVSNGGAITQSAGTSVSAGGNSTINAGSGDLLLGSNLNDLTTVALTGAHITLVDASALTVTSRTQTANRNLYLQAAGTLSVPLQAIDTGTAQLSLLSGAGNFSTPGALSGSDLLLGGVGLTLAHSITATGTLGLISTGSITQSGGTTITATGATSFGAGTFNVTLAQAGNNFSSIGGTGGAVAITDSNAVVLDAINANGLTVNAAGNVTQTAALVISGTTTVNAGAGNVTLTTAGNNLNNLNVSGNALNIVEGAGSALTVLSLSSGLNQPVSLAAGHNLTLPGTAISTGTADLTLISGNTLTLPGALSGNNISLTAVAGLLVNAPITAAGDFDVTVTGGASTMTVNRAVSAGGDMTLNLAGNLSVLASASGLAGLSAAGSQTISAGGNILMQGAGSGSNNRAVIESTDASGIQSVTANGITLLGGADGGGLGTGNYASIRTTGDQMVTVGNGGITLTGGGGSQTGNHATIEQNGGAGTSQSITVNGTGSIVATGGSSALSGTDTAIGSHAGITTENGDSQTITFTGTGAGRAITLTGGTVGSDAYAEILTGVGTQSITGAGLITLTGGASGGGASFPVQDTTGNVAAISADNADQTIVASGLVLQGGAAGLNNFAVVYGGGNQSITVGAAGLQLLGGGGGASDAKNAAIVLKGNDVPGTSQTITVTNGGAIVLQGGNATASNVGVDANLLNLSNGAFASIRSDGIAQLFEFTGSGSSITITGGTAGSDNHAMVYADTGTQTIRGTVDAHAPSLSLTGGATGGVGGAANEGNRALIFSRVGNQAISVASIDLVGGASGTENLAQIRQGNTTDGLASTQTVTVVGGGDIFMQGGGGTTNLARIRAHGTSQLVNFTAGGSIDLTGGNGSIDNFAQIVAHNGDQTISGADGITLTGGTAGDNNRAQITANLGSQTLGIGAGGLSMTGGSGAAGDLANWASVFQGGTAGKSQIITVAGGGDITLQGGSSAGTSVGQDNGSLAAITNQGDSQLIEFSGPGSSISITGGTVGSRNEAGIFAINGSQTIRGTVAANAPAITLTGGASGGLAGEGNFATIFAITGNQTVSAAAVTLQGGAGGTENRATILADNGNQSLSAASLQLQGGAGGTSNLAQVRQGTTTTGLASTQTVQIQDGANSNFIGGGGNTNLARIQSFGTAQNVDLGAGGALNLVGGTGVGLNFARIEALNGNQVISGSADISLTGGASGGSAGNGNFADFRSRGTGNTQSVNAQSLSIVGGAGGTDNSATITSDGTQTVSLQTAGSNALVIGAAGSANFSGIVGNSQTVIAGSGAQSGSITIVGGAGVGKNASISTSSVAMLNGPQTVSTTGTLTLVGGSAAGTGTTCDPALGSGSCGNISNSGTGLQTVTANALLLQGGNAGVSNGAGIFVNGGNMLLNIGTGGLTTISGSGGTANFATIGGGNASGSTLTVNVAGNTLLDASNGTDGSGTLIGLGGTGDGGTITIDFNGTGNLTALGSNASPNLSGAGIGTGTNQTNATANITVDAANITLTAGSQSRAQIGHKLGNGGLGNIAVNASGNIAMNSVGATLDGAAAIRTGGNVTLAAGGAITQSADATIEANLLTATANGGGILLDSVGNRVGTLNATVPFFNSGDILFTNGPGMALAVNGVTMAGSSTQARITADDIQITGAVSNAGGPVVLRPLDLTRNVHIENSPTGGVLSLSPTELQLVTNASVLDIGRLDGTGTLSVFNDITSANVNANMLRLLTGTDYLHTSGASIGSGATPFAHNLEIRAGNNLQLTNGNIFLLDNKSLKLFADNDGSTLGSVNIGAGTYRVGSSVNNSTGTMELKGAEITIAVSGGGSGLVEVLGSGSQVLTATDVDITIDNANNGTGTLTVRTDTGPQTLTAAGIVSVVAGTGTGTSTYVRSGGNQTITAQGMFIEGRTSGAVGDGNSVWVESFGNQNVTLDSIGLTLASGGGASATKDHAAMLNQLGTAGTSQTITLNNGGSIYMEGGASTLTNVGGNGHGSRALIESDGDAQTITLNGGGSIDLIGGTNGSRAYAQIYAKTGTQTVTGASTLSLVAGASGGFDGEGNTARIAADAGAQTISADTITLIGGASGIENTAMLFGAGGQTITTDFLTLTGGADGGGFSDGNRAYVGSNANQVLNIANALVIQGGGGSLSDNAAQIEQLGLTGSQTLNLGTSVSVLLFGGSSAGTNVGGTGHGSRASIYSQGTSQSLLFGANGTLSLVGGTNGSRNFAQIFAENTGNQSITGAPTITLTGGASGGIAGEGNSAYIATNAGSQTISAASITLNAGAGGTENFAQISQGAAANGNTQSISIAAGGSLALQGGNGTSNFARVRSNGVTQLLAFGAGSTLDLTGGTGASNNFARVQAVVGNQTISGNPDITIQGGASGGADLAGNFADIRASSASALQNIAAGNLTLQAGAAGQENFAAVIGANQTISALGDVSLTGGGSQTSLDGTSGGGARIGGLGGASPSPTNLSLTVDGDLTLIGGSTAGAALGSNLVGGQPTTIVVSATGDISLNGGASTASGSRIGSPSASVAAGDIFLDSGGTITLGGLVPGDSAIRTLGDVTLSAVALAIGNQVTGSTIFANAGTVSISGAGQLAATATSGDSIEVVASTSFSNSVGDTALSATAPARWLVYSQDPALDARGGLQLAFKQYNKVFGDATPIAAAGNGFLYSLAPTANVSLTGTVSKTYDGTDVATLAAGNFLVSGGVGSDVVSISSGATGTYDNRNVGTGKTVSTSGVTISALDGTVPVFGYGLASGTATGAVGEINAAALTVSTADVNKAYDATTAAPGAAAIVTAGALVGGDTLSGGSFAFLDPNAGTGKTVTVSGVSISDGNGGLNYILTQAPNTTSSITAANLTLSTSDVVKTYDGTTSAAGSLIVTGGSLFGSDSVSGGTFAFTDKNAGVGNKTVTVGGATVADGNGGLNYNVGYANNTTSTINRANIANVTGIVGVDKVYDGTTSASLITSATGFIGIIGADSLTVASASGSFADRNAGVGKPINVSAITLGGPDAGNYNLVSNTAVTSATISPASLTISPSTVSKSYDGTPAAPGATANVTGGALVGGDTLSGGTFAFLDPNVGTGKTVTASGVTVNDGNGGLNYAVSFTNNTVSSITALAASTWSGLGGNNLWSNPANWDVLPVTGNVLAVTIPAGAGTVVFDASAGTTNLQSLSSQQPVSVTGGNLQLGTSLSAPNLSQSGGTVQVGTTLDAANLTQTGGNLLAGGNVTVGNFSQGTGAGFTSTGALTVSNNFSQSGGSVQVGTALTTGTLAQSAGTLQVGTTLTAGSLSQTGGSLVAGGNVTTSSFNQSGAASLTGSGALSVGGSYSQSGGSVSMGSIAINQASGNLVAGNLVATSTMALTASAGAISQTAALRAGSLVTTSASGTTLGNSANRIGALTATNTGTGNIVLDNSIPLTLGAVTTTAGNIDVTSTGGIDSVGPVVANSGDVTLIANSPLTVGAGGITADGNIMLRATNLTSAGNMTLNGNLFAGNTVSLLADGNLQQNFAVVGTKGVTAVALGSFNFGPLATTNAPPISYTAGGVPVNPPPTVLASSLQAPGDILQTFSDLLQRAIDGPLKDVLETNPDGSKKKKLDDEGIVTEGELCR